MPAGWPPHQSAPRRAPVSAAPPRCPVPAAAGCMAAWEGRRSQRARQVERRERPGPPRCAQQQATERGAQGHGGGERAPLPRAQAACCACDWCGATTSEAGRWCLQPGAQPGPPAACGHGRQQCQQVERAVGRCCHGGQLHQLVDQRHTRGLQGECCSHWNEAWAPQACHMRLGFRHRAAVWWRCCARSQPDTDLVQHVAS